MQPPMKITGIERPDENFDFGQFIPDISKVALARIMDPAAVAPAIDPVVARLGKTLDLLDAAIATAVSLRDLPQRERTLRVPEMRGFDPAAVYMAASGLMSPTDGVPWRQGE